MTDFAGTSRKFEIGRVFQHTFGTIGNNFITFLGLSILLTGVPQALFALIQLDLLGGQTVVEATNQFNYVSILWAAGAGLVVWLSSMVLQAALVHGSIVGLNGRKASFADCLRTGLRHALPVLAITLISALGIMLGLLLLVIPGIFLMILWVVVVPVRVAENRGVFETFSRSARLTEGSRGMILVLFIVYVLLSWIFSAIMMALVMAVVGATGGLASGLAAMADKTSPVMMAVQVVASPLISAMSAMVGASGVAAIYYELRSIKEGAAPEQLASIFD